MEREKVKRILLYCRDIEGEIKHNAKIIQEYEDRYYSLGGSSLGDGMPKAKTVTSTTESAALIVPDFVSGEINELHAQNEQLGKLQIAIFCELNKLTLAQKTILYNFYIKRAKWVRISAHVNYSETQCKKIRNRGLDNLANHFKQNEVIKNFRYPS